MRFDTKFDQYLRSLAKKARRETVRIENPLPGGTTRLKADAAQRHLDRGAAAWNASRTAIRFTEPAVERVKRSWMIDRAIHGKMAAFNEIKRVPVTKPTDLTGPSTQRNFWNRKSVWTDRRESPQRTKR